MKMKSSNVVQILPNYMRDFPPARLRAIRRVLGAWYRTNKRDLPWRLVRDPYRVWISEIMLQQTRVAAVIPYYERFLARFPDVASLAAADDDTLLSAWAGLGYYSRARNLRAAARQIVERGGFPETHAEILELPGIGPYTAAAVASICFDLPHAVLDGNVMRVLARLTRDDGELRSSQTRARLQEAAQRLLGPANPGEHNQAVMELGATVCVPRDPKCEICPVAKDCRARASGLERKLPVKGTMVVPSRMMRTLLVAIRNGNILLWQRARDAAMLGGFWELPEPHQLPEAEFVTLLHQFSHSITNHLYEFRVMTATVAKAPAGFRWMPLGQLSDIPLSTVTRKALPALRVLP